MNQNLLTVVIATYNRKDTVLEALNSALDMEVPLGWDLKVVVVDDGSKDGTYEYLKEQNQLDQTRFHVMRVENGERGRARNLGAKWARENWKPSWLLFLDSDDKLTPKSLLRFSQRIAREESTTFVSFVYGWYTLWDGKNSPSLQSKEFNILPEGNLAERVLRETNISICATMINSRIFFLSGGFPEDRALSGSEDKILLTRLVFYGRVLFCPHLIFWYRQHIGSTPPDRMLKSMSLTEKELDPDLHRYFGLRYPWAKRIFHRHCEYKKAGTANAAGSSWLAFKIYFKTAWQDPMLILDYRSWRLLLSICYRTVRPV